VIEPTDPRDEYTRRLADRRARVSALEAQSLRASNLRVLVFVGAAIALVLILGFDALSPGWLVPFAVGFAVLVVRHDRIIEALGRARDAVRHYEDGLARLDHEFAGRGIGATDFAPDDHPYAADLDLFGRGSLFELMCTARTRSGQEQLAAWLCAPATPDTIATRQRAVEALRERIDLREHLALAGPAVDVDVDPESLTGWAEAPSPLSAGATRALFVVAWSLSVAAVSTTVTWAVGWTGPIPLLGVVLVQWVSTRVFRQRLDQVTRSIERIRRQLTVLAELYVRLARETFTDPDLTRLQATLVGKDSQSRPAFEATRRLERIVSWLEARQNQIFVIIAFLLMWTAHFGLAIERWRARHGNDVRRWLEALAELEALCALAGYAFERPGDPFPEVIEDGPELIGEGLGHPLLAPDANVRNSIDLGDPVAVMVVSGSNMSGKSTLLRTVGINVVLALAGAPVRAQRLRVSVLQIGATLRIQDSLREGASRFYAEIRRLRQIMDLARSGPPLLFLIDEILHGTNSHDRKIGGERIVRALVDANAIGLVTTHDLALAGIADALGERACNVHFTDEVVDGELHFDYRMRPGIVRKSNALALMRSIGLDV
jgi:hypothetical protein